MLRPLWGARPETNRLTDANYIMWLIFHHGGNEGLRLNRDCSCFKCHYTQTLLFNFHSGETLWTPSAPRNWIQGLAEVKQEDEEKRNSRPRKCDTEFIRIWNPALILSDLWLRKGSNFFLRNIKQTRSKDCVMLLEEHNQLLIKPRLPESSADDLELTKTPYVVLLEVNDQFIIKPRLQKSTAACPQFWYFIF